MDAFAGKKVQVTGGLGFNGSTLAIKLAEIGAEVRIVDNMLPGLGGNLFNVDEILDKIKINFSDIRDENSMGYLSNIGAMYDFTLSLRSLKGRGNPI